MGDVLDQLLPIVEVVGEDGVKASYADGTIWSTTLGIFTPGWTVEIDATYRGARIRLKEEATSLEDAATAAFNRLVAALGLKK